MKISFCLTTYNKKELLEITIQNYIINRKENYELIVSDGCSTDGTVEFLQELKQNNVIDTLILSQYRDNGEWEGFKKTLPHVTGEYFYLITDDDYFDFRAIDILVENLKQNPQIDFLIADGMDFHVNHVKDSNYHHKLKKANTTKINRNGLIHGVCGLGLFIKSELINQLDLFSPKFGKRTDKTVTTTLMDSEYVGASTNIKTYVAIKNEKSNSHLARYDYQSIEQIDPLNDPTKDFLCDAAFFKQRFDVSQSILDQCKNANPEIIIYEKED
jgi:glycosyltransferase involved in cell wall biosynthesis